MRKTAVAVMTVALLGVSVIGTAGQEEEFMYPLPYVEGVTLVTGVHVMGYMGANRSVADDGTVTVEGFFTGGERTTDPRTTGRWHWDWTFEHSGNGVGAWWGPCGLKDAEGGTWDGSCTGVRYPSPPGGPPEFASGEFGTTWAFTGWYSGTREYEGLTYYTHGTGDSVVGTITGVIYEGDPPPAE